MTMMDRLQRVPASGFDPTADWRKLPLAVIDVETSGLDPVVDRVIEWGIALFNEGKFERSMGGFINPSCDISEEVTKIHGITNEQLREEGVPKFEDAYEIIRTALENRIPVAYNAEFDRSFMLNEAGRVIRKMVIGQVREMGSVTITPEMIEKTLNPDTLPAAFRGNVEWIDPLVWVRHIQKYEKGKKLTDVCARLGIELKAHRAEADAAAAGEVLLMLAPRIDADTYYRLLDMQKKLSISQEKEYQAWRRRQPGGNHE